MRHPAEIFDAARIATPNYQAHWYHAWADAEERAAEYRTDRDTWRALAYFALAAFLGCAIALVAAWWGH